MSLEAENSPKGTRKKRDSLFIVLVVESMWNLFLLILIAFINLILIQTDNYQTFRCVSKESRKKCVYLTPPSGTTIINSTRIKRDSY